MLQTWPENLENGTAKQVCRQHFVVFNHSLSCAIIFTTPCSFGSPLRCCIQFFKVLPKLCFNIKCPSSRFFVWWGIPSLNTQLFEHFQLNNILISMARIFAGSPASSGVRCEELNLNTRLILVLRLDRIFHIPGDLDIISFLTIK